MAISSEKGKGSRRRNETRSRQGADAPQIAYHMSTLCVLETALLIYYPGAKAFSSGRKKMHVYEISPDEAKCWATIKRLSEENADVCEKLKAAKLQSEQVQEMDLDRQIKDLTLMDNRPLHELNLKELLMLHSLYGDLTEKLKKYRQKRIDEAAASTSMSAGDGSTDGGSSAAPHEN